MRVSSVLVIQALTWLAAAIPTAPIAGFQPEFDVLIIGGGPAGLSAASALGRVRRKVLLIDSGEYRNQATRRIHDVIGFDGVTPAYFRWRARQQIAEYDTVRLMNGSVHQILPRENNTYFAIAERHGTRLTSYFYARKIILATGIRDVLPSTPGLQENFGKGIYWCPWCDGHEHADQSMGVLGPLGKSGDTALEILSLNKDITLFVNGTDTLEQRAIVDKKLPKWDTWLRLQNITIDNRIIASFDRIRDGANFNDDPCKATHAEYDSFRVNFKDGTSTNRSVFITNFPSEQRSKLGEEMGVALYDGKLAADLTQGMISNVPGVYCVGDANSDNSTNVPHTMWSGKRAVVSLHVRLETENAQSQISDLSRRSDELEERSLWERLSEPGDVLEAGEFDQFLFKE